IDRVTVSTSGSSGTIHIVCGREAASAATGSSDSRSALRRASAAGAGRDTAAGTAATRERLAPQSSTRRRGAGRPAGGPLLAFLREHLDVRGDREEIVLQIPVDLDRLRVHLEDLGAVPVALDLVGPFHAAADVAKVPEARHLRVEVLVLGIAP